MNIKNDKIKVAVLTGGFSSERNVALAGAYNVACSLRKVGYQVNIIDTCSGLISYQNEYLFDGIQANLPDAEQLKELERLDQLMDILSTSLKNYNVVFPVMHGKIGENGVLQAGLELARVPYVGSNHAGSALAMDKEISKRLFEALMIPTPKWLKWPVTNNELAKLSFPLIVKPAKEGSTVGINLVTVENDLLNAVNNALKYDKEVIIEEYIAGREFTVGILDNFALAAGEIISAKNLFDYTSKYTCNGATEIFPAKISTQLERDLKYYAVQVHRLLKLRHFSRIDFRVSESEQIYVLEANSIPGLTKLSLLPQSAAAAGYQFPLFCDYLCRLALNEKIGPIQRRSQKKTLFQVPKNNLSLCEKA